MTRTQVYLPAGHHRALRREARTKGISLTELVRRLVADHVEAGGGLGAAALPASLDDDRQRPAVTNHIHVDQGRLQVHGERAGETFQRIAEADEADRQPLRHQGHS
jgi:hypothetical protein